MPSRNGWVVLAAAAAGLLFGRLFGIVELFILSAGLITLVVAAVARTVTRTCGLVVERATEPARPEVGDDARVTLMIGARSSSPAVDLWEPVAGVGGAALRVAPLRRGESTSASYRLPTRRRGLVRVGPLSGEMRDSFGLARRTTWLAPARDVLVYPTAVQVPLPQLGAGTGPLSRWLARRALGHPSADEFRSLRDYVPGDDLRRVNWRVTARRDALVVRESDPAASLHLTVVFDLHANAYSADGFERAVAVVASLAVSAVQLDRRIRLITTDSQEHVVDAVHLDEVLEHLALVEPAAGRVPPPGRSGADGMHLVIVVTGGIDTSRLSLMRVIAGNADAGVVVTCEPASEAPAGWFALPATSIEEFARGWDDLVGRVDPSALRRTVRA